MLLKLGDLYINLAQVLYFEPLKLDTGGLGYYIHFVNGEGYALTEDDVRNFQTAMSNLAANALAGQMQALRGNGGLRIG